MKSLARFGVIFGISASAIFTLYLGMLMLLNPTERYFDYYSHSELSPMQVLGSWMVASFFVGFILGILGLKFVSYFKNWQRSSFRVFTSILPIVFVLFLFAVASFVLDGASGVLARFFAVPAIVGTVVFTFLTERELVGPKS